jgi:formylglycine-generating enzyme required for sulfatase activity
VQKVSWSAAILFCNWLSGQEGREVCYEATGDREFKYHSSKNGYRLLTEAEWEYACRARTTTTYSFGRDSKWFSEHGVVAEHKNLHSSPVASRLPNGFGLFDMHGNISEWTWDWFAPYDQEDATNPTGPLNGSRRVVRGGAFLEYWAVKCSSAVRLGHVPKTEWSHVGFRVACGVNDLR